MERHRRDHQRRAKNAQNNEGFTAAFCNGQLRKAEFGSADHQQGIERQLRMHGLEFHNAEQQQRIKQRRHRGHMFLEGRLYFSYDIGDAKHEPIEKQQSRAGLIFRERLPVSAFHPKQLVEPIQVVEETGENAEDLQLEPVQLDGDAYQT